MSEKSHSIRDGIIVTVGGGLILAGLLYFIPSAWHQTIILFTEAKYFLISAVEISTWVYLVLIIMAAFFLIRETLGTIRLIFADRNTKPAQIRKVQGIGAKPVEFEAREEDQISAEEKLVLTLLTKVDGRGLSLSEISAGIHRSQIRTQHALDKLIKKKHITQGPIFDFGGGIFQLTARGREVVIRHNLDSMVK